MNSKTKEDYAKYRLEKAERCIRTAELDLSDDDYEGAANRSYYGIYHSVRAILALDGVDFKRHSGVISYFRREYIKTGVFDKELSVIIGDAFEARGGSDYDDFYAISKERVKEQIENAKRFYAIIYKYINKRIAD